ncbi:MAG: ATP-dependent DNA helicase [Candidatus Woesearchaeota archaeon]
MPSNQNSISFFPYAEMRKYQQELIDNISKTLESKGRLVVEAPTGLGKTASALSPALSYALEKDLTIWFLTNRHTQHWLAVETLKAIREKFGINFNCVNLVGKKEMCNQEVKDLFGNEFNEFCRSITEKDECEYYNNVKSKNKLTPQAAAVVESLLKRGPLHKEEVVEACKEKDLCSYEISLELGKKAKVVIGDYYYLFNPHVQNAIFNKMGKEPEKSILIVDEAHNLPYRVVDMLSHKLTDFMLKNALGEAKKQGFNDAAAAIEKISRALIRLNRDNPDQENLVTKKDFIDLIPDYEGLLDELVVAGDEIRKNKRRSYVGGVANFLEAWKGEDDGFARIVSEKEGKYGNVISLNYDCLDPGLATAGVFEKVHSAVLMSGTLHPTFMYNDLLRVKGKEATYPNPFPAENKLTLIVPETTTKYALRGEKMYKMIAERCSAMLELIPGNCAVFFPSYHLMQQIGVLIQSKKKRFWEKSEMNKEEKEEFLESFKQEKDVGGVLLGVMGGSFGEGVDLPGDLLQGVIIVGIPLGKPDLKTKEMMKYFDDKFGRGWDYGYLYPAISKCFQSAGRCIRSETDKGAVVFLDERFAWERYFCCFPRENVIVSKDFSKFLGDFFD